MPTSESFFTTDSITASEQFSELTPLPSQGCCLLVKAQRYGRWWLLKGLKQEYRQVTFYKTFLQKEYDILRQMQHPMVVSAFSFELVEGLGQCIVMEWIEGTTLKQWMQQRHSLSERRHLADQLLEAVGYVHSRQTEHRDLKPSNIMVSHNGQYVKLIDFGLSDTADYAILKAPAGTEGYMAPEGPSDIYSLGCILRELRLGPASRLVIGRCLAPKARRYTDVTALKNALHRCWYWPRRLLVVLCVALLVAGLYMLNNSQTQQALQVVNDSLRVAKEENVAIVHAERAKYDSLHHEMQIISEQRQAEQKAKDDAARRLQEAKRRIDRQMLATGVQQMLDTVSYSLNIHIPFTRIINEMKQNIKEQELKDYIDEKYLKPWERQMSELPWDFKEAKYRIDSKLTDSGIQQMFDTVSCRRNIHIPFLQITDEMIKNAKDPALKDYINEKYRKPWIKRMNELPDD